MLFGGRSTEHEVSIETAKKIISALDRKKYIIEAKKIPKTGNFNFNSLKKYDVIFPVFHGPFGEDGTIQGMLKLMNIPFVGAGVLGSAVGMDKDVMKRLFTEAGISIGKFIVSRKIDDIGFNEAKRKLGLPVFVKPANTGSSVGVSKVKNKNEFAQAVNIAFQFDTKVIIEEAIVGREIECGVVGNEDPIATLPGEIIPTHEFYSYEAKYIDENGAVLEIPAKISSAKAKEIQRIATKVFKILNCEGMGRVDFFLKKNGEVLVNEINTIPGPVMFRKLWEASGVSFPKLLDKLINLAIERFKKEQKLKTSVK